MNTRKVFLLLFNTMNLCKILVRYVLTILISNGVKSISMSLEYNVTQKIIRYLIEVQGTLFNLLLLLLIII